MVVGLLRDGFLLGLVVAWVTCLVWIARDVRARTTDRRAARLATAIGVVPVAGAIVYLCIRPPETLEQRRERRLARRLFEAELDPGERCLSCRTPLRPEFLCCPGCGESLRRPCGGCGRPLAYTWSVCPHCEEPALEPDAPLRVIA
jgi:double zinc ribbon protein